MLVSSVLFALAACAGSDGRSADVTSPRAPTGVTTPTPAPLPVANAGLSGKALVYDDFVKYSNTAALQNNISTVAGGKGSHSTALYKDGYNASLAELDKSVLYNGHATLKYNQPAGTTKTPALWIYFPNGKKLTNMWLRAKVRYSASFTTAGTRSASNAYTLLGWGWDGANGYGQIQFINTSQYSTNWNVASSTLSGPFVSKSSSRVTNEWKDGQWYDYIVHYERVSSTSVRQSWWLAKDGQTPVLQATITGTMTKGSVPLLNRVMLGLSFNAQRTASQALWFGQWEVVDGAQSADPFGVKGGTTNPGPTPTPTPTPDPDPEPTPNPGTTPGTTPPDTNSSTPGTDGGTTSPNPTPGSTVGLSGKAFAYDDFRSYSGTAALQANISTTAGGKGTGSSLYQDGYNAHLAEIDKTVLYNGHQTLKYNQPAGQTGVPALWHYFANKKTLTKMWFRVKIRFSPGFTTRGVTPGAANAYKLLGWGWSGADGRSTIEISNTDQYFLNWQVVKSDNSLVGPFVYKAPTRIGSEWTDGRWYDYIVYYEQTSPTTIRQSWWMARDGEKPVLQSTVIGSMTKGTVPAVARVMLGLNFNSQRTTSQALWYGQWEVVDGNVHSNPFGVL